MRQLILITASAIFLVTCQSGETDGPVAPDEPANAEDGPDIEKASTGLTTPTSTVPGDSLTRSGTPTSPTATRSGALPASGDEPLKWDRGAAEAAFTDALKEFIKGSEGELSTSDGLKAMASAVKTLFRQIEVVNTSISQLQAGKPTLADNEEDGASSDQLKSIMEQLDQLNSQREALRNSAETMRKSLEEAKRELGDKTAAAALQGLIDELKEAQTQSLLDGASSEADAGAGTSAAAKEGMGSTSPVIGQAAAQTSPRSTIGDSSVKKTGGKKK